MSQSPAFVILRDGTKYYGIYNNTTGQMLPNLYLSLSERDHNWRPRPSEYPKCECEGETCIAVSDEMDHDSAEPGKGQPFLHIWPATICVEHMIFKGPFDPTGIHIDVPTFSMVFQGWNDADLMWRDHVRANKPTISRTFLNIIVKLYVVSVGKEPETKELEQMINWID